MEVIIGLEIHVQLKTKSKMFCACDNTADETKPNSSVCPICLGHPGTLPMPNRLAIEYAIKAGLALNCQIASLTKFDRKHYFYPDLPKGYQISQFDLPIAEKGFLEIRFDENTTKKIRITRLHMEEDAGKNIHTKNHSLIDFNRSGTPLIEIVTEPDFETPAQAKIFLQELRAIMRYLNVSDADMEKGNMRCDANISLRPNGETQLYPKTEIKNINSFKAVERALIYEIQRQTELWSAKTPPTKQTTRGWDDLTQTTIERRIKEQSHDYRYFTEPDIPPISISKKDIEIIRQTLPESPNKKLNRYQEEYGMSFDVARQIVHDKHLADYSERVISESHAWLDALGDKANQTERNQILIKLINGWLLSKLIPIMEKNQMNFENISITPENFAEFLSLIYKKALNNQTGLSVLEKMSDPKTKDSDPSHIMETLGLTTIDTPVETEDVIANILKENPKQVDQYKNGKTEVINFLLGQVIKACKGKIKPEIALEYLKKKME